MSNPVPSRQRIALNLSLLDDTERETTLTGIEKVAPQSVLIQIAAIAASFAALSTKGSAFAADASKAAADASVAKASANARDASRATFDLELVALKGLVENNAKSAVDVTGMGFTPLIVAKASRSPPDPPGALIVKPGKAHGKARVSVAAPGNHGRFVAQASTDPIGPATWTLLAGTGSSRTLSGYPSGTKLWVRFALVRFGMQSDWYTPVLVTIP